jgi:alpha-L-fucosidase 2
MLAHAAGRDFDTLKARHITDHQSLYNRMRLDLGKLEPSALPTDRRLIAYTKGGEDPALEALLFHYGRYLLIASSRPGGLPANLQGIWNDNPNPPWYSGYTTNINVEMNYWPADPTNLAEVAGPLFDWIDRVAIAQKLNPDPRLRTKRGWIIYSTNNPLGGNSGWAMHRPGSAWLSRHFYEAWAYSGDREFLSKRAYEHLKPLAQMWDEHLIEDENGKLITPDGWSPEHGPVRRPDGTIELVGGDRTPQPGASYDQQIVWDLFTNFIEASEALGRDPELREHIRSRRDKLLAPHDPPRPTHRGGPCRRRIHRGPSSAQICPRSPHRQHRDPRHAQRRPGGRKHPCRRPARPSAGNPAGPPPPHLAARQLACG